MGIVLVTKFVKLIVFEGHKLLGVELLTTGFVGAASMVQLTVLSVALVQVEAVLLVCISICVFPEVAMLAPEVYAAHDDQLLPSLVLNSTMSVPLPPLPAVRAADTLAVVPAQTAAVFGVLASVPDVGAASMVQLTVLSAALVQVEAVLIVLISTPVNPEVAMLAPEV